MEMNKVEKIFDQAATNWDKSEEKRFDAVHQETIANTKKYLNSTDIVLDYGCATGTKAIELAGNVRRIHAIDLSIKMIEIAKRKAIDRNIGNVDFTKTTIFDEAFKPGSFDVIMAFNILHFLEDIQQVMHRFAELLKPGGLFISATPCLREKMSLLIKLQFTPIRLLSKVGLFPSIKRFKFNDLDDLIVNGKFQIVKTEIFIHEMSSYFIVAKKI
jgi:2-polyprenyl-3-methyl-5-hydroxy-6-metoxy-1,4-benzoquinol methylase